MKKVFLWAVLLLALPAHAEWTKVPGTESDAAIVYIDLTTIKAQGQDGRERRAWFLFDYSKPDKSVRSVRALLELNCESVAMSQVTATHFAGQMAKGKVLKEAGFGGREYVPPDTRMATVLKYVCAYDPKAQ